MRSFRSADMRQLLHNKFVVVLGDSIQRGVYKDLVKLLQVDDLLTEAQLKAWGKFTFMNDTLVEGGEREKMHNGITFREVRQYRTSHHLVRFYFLTRVYSAYMESILSDFKSGPQPDVLLVNSCIWDLMRYGDNRLEAYKSNLDVLFQRLKEVLSPQCLIIWTMTMPVGFRPHEMLEWTPHNRREDIVEGNFFSAILANFHQLDVLDMHYHFRFDLRFRCGDSVHWNKLAHRKYTQILLAHIAEAWGVEVPTGEMSQGSTVQAVPPQQPTPPQHTPPKQPTPPQQPTPPRQPTVLSFFSPAAVYMPGYISFDGSDINDMPGVSCPGEYTNKNLNSDAVSPFVSDSPLLTANMKPGYFNPPGPKFSNYRNAFPPPHPQKAWNMKSKTRRALKPRGGWVHPYH